MAACARCGTLRSDVTFAEGNRFGVARKANNMVSSGRWTNERAAKEASAAKEDHIEARQKLREHLAEHSNLRVS